MIAALLLAGFVYAAEVDPFTDEITHVAQAGTNDGPLLVVACGARTEGRLTVMVSTGRSMYRPPVAMVGRYPERVRFDDATTVEFGFRYNGDAAFLTGDDAQEFVAAMKQAETVLLEVENYRGEKLQMQIPLAGAADSVARVEENCPT